MEEAGATNGKKSMGKIKSRSRTKELEEPVSQLNSTILYLICPSCCLPPVKENANEEIIETDESEPEPVDKLETFGINGLVQRSDLQELYSPKNCVEKGLLT